MDCCTYPIENKSPNLLVCSWWAHHPPRHQVWLLSGFSGGFNWPSRHRNSVIRTEAVPSPWKRTASPELQQTRHLGLLLVVYAQGCLHSPTVNPHKKVNTVKQILWNGFHLWNLEIGLSVHKLCSNGDTTFAIARTILSGLEISISVLAAMAAHSSQVKSHFCFASAQDRARQCDSDGRVLQYFDPAFL